VYARPVAFTAISPQSKSHVAGRFGSFAVDPITVHRIVCPITGSDISRHFVLPDGDWKPSTLDGAGDATVVGATNTAVVDAGDATVVGAAVRAMLEGVKTAVEAGLGAVVETTKVVVALGTTLVVGGVVRFVVTGRLTRVVSVAMLFAVSMSPTDSAGVIVTVFLITPLAVGRTAAVTVNTSGLLCETGRVLSIAPIPGFSVDSCNHVTSE
jgi:hypothetical protein